MTTFRTVLICHSENRLNRECLAGWLASFSELSGIVLIRDSRKRRWRRVKREFARSGLVGLTDVMLFRAFYPLIFGRADGEKESSLIERLKQEYPLPRDIPTMYCESPNGAAARQFIQEAQPDIAIARCGVILRKSVFSIPTRGTFVMHPGICPEYRNAHGCFWALQRRDLNKVGMTLLKIDEGVDTGPIFGYYSYPYDEKRESHVQIQNRVVFENLDKLRHKLEQISTGQASTIQTNGRTSAVWGQPRLTSYIGWKLSARKAS
jgi:methionyl-tRNA formyltransferase